jgi:hypothetical protein
MLFDDIGEFCYLCGVSFIQHMVQYSPKYFGKILKLLRHVRAAHSLDLNEPPSSNKSPAIEYLSTALSWNFMLEMERIDAARLAYERSLLSTDPAGARERSNI